MGGAGAKQIALMAIVAFGVILLTNKVASLRRIVSY